MSTVKICFLQVSDNLINSQEGTDVAGEYYRGIWETMGDVGYVRPEHYWEIPTWIAEIDGMVCHNPDVETGLHHITDMSGALPTGYDMYFASVLDCNKDILAKLAYKNHACHFVFGGYIGLDGFLDTFSDMYNTVWIDSLEKLCGYMQHLGHNINYNRNTSYRLFRNVECIPRLALSDGCKHNCKFCSIPNEVTERTSDDISSQIMAMKDLIFERVYINDKTFGQAGNWKDVKYIYNSIKMFRPYFQGFTIQTSAITMVKMMCDDIDLKKYGIRTVEFGLESYNNDIYRKYNKPQCTATVNTCMDYLIRQGVEIIPNIIIGLPGENIHTYSRTINWLNEFKEHFLMLNVTNFVPYEGTEANEGMVKETADCNQAITRRSWHTEKEGAAAQAYSEMIFELGLEILGRNRDGRNKAETV